MKIEPIRLAELARHVGGEVEGNPDTVITGVAPIEQAAGGDLTFIAQPRFLDQLERTPAAAVLLARNLAATSSRCALIRVDNPYFAFIRILQKVLPGPEVTHGIAATAQVHPRARVGREVSIGPYAVVEAGCEIGDGVQIGAHCYVGAKVRIGTNSVLFPHVCLGHEVVIGRNVIIQFGSVIGSDGFGYLRHEGRYHKIPHLGTVVIEDEVEIGANCTIDRGTFGQTHLRRGAKLDNLIHVAHNVEIGEHTVIAAQTGISGSTKIGREVTIAGQVGFVGHIEIGDRTTFGAQAGVTKSIPPGMVVSGYPARDHAQARREEAAIRRLPELLKRVRTLEKLLAATGRLPSAANGLRDD
ncbi:MAG: UDP-3-O-(3-hydroxymyristoyl)glucosamine N-acyltransferase [candidate division KSB1 bacterium]|nr:UDP-3-O-(3-hydroxymyristoyl)glucosamine N-acyltransferase [candidate division KSB1 bacterium]MDZ7276485.1 UDP-3-O-(3-hydroxymyristoyl)glucosamine N-acyltransferase [candidate division KSB1 bacterium]MDZ7286734.1 UDP-3-O-(3-hydroxymyristoyl)glucosamine N-acyltransferase [candidate division KSB1 bacterium]MDZ7300255.1 UDP-3-O-(3-hydroxymyristoyl)glucosamine N-acyltransferase [candidate division KSB1 bacterium]MDZ7308590.1 UDP-3-O-(3-hydroxymyristoyl)glucosamine N-acyltransferase [candidate div